MADRPIEVRLRDPLRELARKERKGLLAVSVAAIAIVHGGLFPTQIAALGLTFNPANKTALFRIAAGIVLYFLLAFLIYAVNDWLAGRWALQLAIEDHAKQEMDALRKQLEEGVAAAQISEAAAKAHQIRVDLETRVREMSKRITEATTPILAVRDAFEFALPLGLGVYALLALIRSW